MISRVKVNAQLRINGRINYIRALTKSVCRNLEKKALPQMKLREGKIKLLETLCNRWFPPNLAEHLDQSKSKRPTMIAACLHLLLVQLLISQECKICRVLMSKLRIQVKTIKITANQF